MISRSQRLKSPFIWLMVVVVSIVFFTSQTVCAGIITVDATGTDTGAVTDYWGVEFTAGTGFIQSLTIDLSGEPNIYFDFDGESGGETEPIFGSLVGLLDSDISHLGSNFVGGDSGRPATLELSFLPNTFGVGDSFRFTADTDGWIRGTPSDPGGEFAGIPVSVTMFGGTSGSSVFSFVSNEQSVAVVNTSVPEPSSFLIMLGLAGLAGIGLGFVRRR